MLLSPRTLASVGLASALLLAAASPALAQDPEPAPEAGATGAPAPTEPEPAQVEPEPAAPAPGGYPQPTLHGELALSLEDAIRMGLENNLDVEVVRYDPYIAWEDVKQAWGAYDPELFADFAYQNFELENSFSITGQTLSEERQWAGAGGFRGVLPLLGSTYNLQYDSGRFDSNSTIEALSPKYESSFNVSLSQPLLRDLYWNPPWFRVRSTRIFYDSSLDQFRKDVMDVVQQIQNLYWNLIARQDQVRVAEKSLETARALLDQTRTQHDVGVVSRVEVVEAEAGVAQREFELIRAQNLYRNSQDQLIDAVLGTGLTADSTLQIQPTDRPEDYIPFAIDPEQAVETAFQNRPEIALADQAIEQGEISLAYAKNQRLPRLDAHVAYGNQGLAGDQNPNLRSFATTLVPDGPDPDALPDIVPVPVDPNLIPPTSWGQSMDRFLTNRAAEQVVAGAIFSIPIPNTSARHRVSQAELELRQANSQKRRLEQSIILEVRTAIRNLSDSQKGIDAARRATVAAEEQLRAERIRLEYGESTPFDVLLRESDLVGAQSEEINAFQAYRTSATGLDRAQGTILRNSNISIDAVRALR
jgi:outer membrane protein TolC